MYAVIQTGGKQFRVSAGQTIEVERLPAEVGAAVVFDRVLLVLDGDDRLKLGSPMLETVQVRGTVIRQDRNKKVLSYIFKHRQNANRRRRGHRQYLTTVKIDAIEA